MSQFFDVFVLKDQDGRLLDPSIQANVLAKYSRSAQSAREMLKNITREMADKFHEEFVVNYGHSSIIELAVIPVCFEGISIVASKFIERWQRAGYSEKSTRYQKFSRDSFIVPPGLPDSMKEFSGNLYDTYDDLLPKMIKHCKTLMPSGTKRKAIKARAFDNVRYLLPAGTGTNVACVFNARDARDMIVELISHSNPELRHLGRKLDEALQEVIPVLVKHNGPHDFNFEIKKLNNYTRHVPYVHIIDNSDVSDVQAINTLQLNRFKKKVNDWYGLSWGEFCSKMKSRFKYAQKPLPDVFKTIKITFEMMMDYGAFRDLQRHRRCEQFVEPLTFNYGYVVPDDIQGTEFETQYREAMEHVRYYNDSRVFNNVELMQYMIPLGYLHKSQFQMDLKEVYYIVELRTKPHGHISYRRIAYEMFEKCNNYLPELMQWCHAVEPNEIGAHE